MIISISVMLLVLAKIVGGFLISLPLMLFFFAPLNDKDPKHPVRNYLICLAIIYFMIFYGFSQIEFVA